MFMLPILAGNVFQQLYSAVDTIIVGRTLGSDALASVGSIGSLQFLVFGFCSGLAGGVTVVTSQFIGAGKTENARRSTAVIYMIWAVVSLLCTVVGIVCLPGLLHILNMPEKSVSACVCLSAGLLYRTWRTAFIQRGIKPFKGDWKQ